MTSTTVPGTDTILSTKRTRVGSYAVTCAVICSPNYTITRSNSNATWDLRLDGTMAAYGCRTIKQALREAAARYTHDMLWVAYENRLAAYEAKSKRQPNGIGRMFKPKPNTRNIDLGYEGLPLDASIVACRIGHDSLMPGYEVFLEGVSVGFLCLYGARWHVEGTGRWYDHDWVNLRHGMGTKAPEDEARYLLSRAIRITTRRYLATEIARRDDAADEVEQQSRRRS